MKNTLTLAGRASALTLLSLFATQVLAAGVGSITHSPVISGVPMLGGAGLVVLSVLLGLVSLRFFKDRSRQGSTFVIAATLTGAIAAAGGGITLINEAQAVGASVLMSKSAGGTVEIPFNGFNSVLNDTSLPQQIKDISAEAPCYIIDDELNGGIMSGANSNGGMPNGGGNGGSFRGTCSDEGSDGTVLQPNDRCEVFVCCPFTNGGNGGLQGGNGGGCFDL
jgi:hypothetical protein